MAEHTRVLPDEIREGAQKPFRFLQKVGNIIVSLIMITVVAIFVVSWLSKKSDEYEKKKKLSLLSIETKTESSYGQIDTQQKGTGSGVRYKHIVAPVFPEWSREINTREYDWSCDKDMAAGLSNMNNLIAVKYKNDNGIQIAYEERLPDGRIADLYIPNANADWVRVSSLETYPVSSLVTLTKKN